MIMTVQEFDVVQLKDGREGTIVHVFTEPQLAYLIEISDKGGSIETFEPEQINKVIWKDR